MKYVLIIILGILICITAWSVAQRLYVSKLEKPAYKVLKKEDGYQIRKYPSYITASYDVKDPASNREKMNIGFRNVAGYIFGDNKIDGGENEKIAMTSPVIESGPSLKIEMTTPVIEEDSSSNKVSFILPSKYTLDTLPVPNNKDIKLDKTPETIWAVLKFPGLADDEKRDKYTDLLLEKVEKDGYGHSRIQYAYYDPPTTLPPLRTNEVWIEITNFKE